jgi:LuxR family maltose regulon positive regulatory protein
VRVSALIEILALQAVAMHHQGNIPRALAALTQALALAEPEDYARVFLDEGKRMVDLLARLAAPVVSTQLRDKVPTQPGLGRRPARPGSWGDEGGTPSLPDYVARLLAASVVEEVRAATVAPGDQALIEPPSARELEVLRWIAAGLSNQEIADRLVISVRTVKKHIENCYEKLGVNSRTQAIARARELALL